MKTYVYCKCGARSGPRKWLTDGWLRYQVRYASGKSSNFYTCAECRARNIAAWEAKQAATKGGQP